MRYEVNAVMLGAVGMVQARVAPHCTAVLAPRARAALGRGCARPAHATAQYQLMLPRRVRCPRRRAMPVQRARAPEQARGDISPQKNCCDKQVPVETYQLSH